MARRRKSSAAEDLMDLMPCYSSFRAVGFTGFSPRPRAARYFFASSQGTELPVASNLAQCVFRSDVDTDSDPRWSLIPIRGGHRFRSDVVTDSDPT